MDFSKLKESREKDKPGKIVLSRNKLYQRLTQDEPNIQVPEQTNAQTMHKVRDRSQDLSKYLKEVVRPKHKTPDGKTRTVDKNPRKKRDSG